MRVLFVNPVVDPHVNPGLIYVMTCAGQYHEVQLLDFVYDYMDYQGHIRREVKKAPDLIGVTCNSFTYAYGLKVVAELKRLFPRSLAIFGGAQPTLLPEETIAHPLVDAICIGEGEHALIEYLSMLNQGKSSPIAGIWHKDALGKIVKGALRPFYQDLDALPFPKWEYYDIAKYIRSSMHLYRGLLHLIARGCPYSCTYCSEATIRKTIPGKYYRQRSPENVIAEIKYNYTKFKPLGMGGVELFTLTFGLDETWVEDFCRQYRAAGLHVQLPWSFQTRVDLFTESKARMISEAGCAMIAFGIETGDEALRQSSYRKRISNKEVHRAIGILREYNLLWSTNIIVGSPQETPHSLWHTLKLLRALKPDKVYYFFYQPLPFTELSHYAKVMDFTVKPNGWWNEPRVPSAGLSLRTLTMLKYALLLSELWRIGKGGLRARGRRFPLDVLAFIFKLDHEPRLFPLRHPYSLLDLEQNKVDKYAFAEQNRRFLATWGSVQVDPPQTAVGKEASCNPASGDAAPKDP